MPSQDRLSEVFKSAPQLKFSESDKFILFSDCHRGDNSWADDFANNQALFFYALEFYYREGFTYIEIGDGDELWENRDFGEIRKAHSHIFWLLRQFYQEKRLHLIWGNHDMERSDPRKVQQTLYHYYNERTGQEEPLFEGIAVHEGLILRLTGTGNRLFLVHGHQVDPISERWWRLSRFFVRHFWRHLQLLGINDPTSPAKNYRKRSTIDARLAAWVKTKGQILVAGHTHRPRLPRKGEPLYLNTGSCVHPRCITGIEIATGEIRLIKWWIRPDQTAYLQVTREVLESIELGALFRLRAASLSRD